MLSMQVVKYLLEGLESTAHLALIKSLDAVISSEVEQGFSHLCWCDDGSLVLVVIVEEVH